MDVIQRRIERAWKESKSWLTTFDGSPSETYLMNIPADKLAPGMQALSSQVENLRISVIGGEKHDRPEFISLEALPGALAKLQANEIDELSANYAFRSPDFDLDVHMIIYLLKEGLLALELVWWRDQVFSEETDNLEQFSHLARYFVSLQELFAAQKVFISPESTLNPVGQAEIWVEI